MGKRIRCAECHYLREVFKAGEKQQWRCVAPHSSLDLISSTFALIHKHMCATFTQFRGKPRVFDKGGKEVEVELAKLDKAEADKDLARILGRI